MDKEKIAWAAGFFDGEGSTTLKKCGGLKYRPYYYPRISINQNEPSVLYRFQKAFGEYGTITGPRHSPSMGNSKPRYTFEVTGLGAEVILTTMWAYLSEPKRLQAEGVFGDHRRTKKADTHN